MSSPREPAFYCTLTPEPKTARGRKSRDALLEAGRKVFATDGFKGARVADIVEASNLSTGAFYQYFDDKLQLLLTLLADLAAEMYNATSIPWDPTDPLESIWKSTARYLEIYRANADLMGVEIEVAQSEPAVEELWHVCRSQFYGRISRAFQRAVDDGIFHDLVDAELAATILGGWTEYYAYLRFVLKRLPDERDLESVSREMAHMCAYGMMKTGAM